MKKDDGLQGFQFKHSLGQNFITDDDILSSLVTLSGVGSEDSVLEIGPGAGGMTKELAARCKQVLALEIDETLLPILRVALEKYPNVTLVQGDVMKADLPRLTESLGAFHLVANLPYYITTPLFTLLLNSDLPILSMSVMLQKETAEKLCLEAGQKDCCPLGLKLQWFYEMEIAAVLPAKLFTPPPKVDSAFLLLKRRNSPPFAVKDEKILFRLIACAFAMRRKTMVNNMVNTFSLSRAEAAEMLQKCGMAETIRGEQLTMEQFALLADALA